MCSDIGLPSVHDHPKAPRCSSLLVLTAFYCICVDTASLKYCSPTTFHPSSQQGCFVLTARAKSFPRELYSSLPCKTRIHNGTGRRGVHEERPLVGQDILGCGKFRA